ncbi:hypothetical protein SUDANB120_05927 [Streptomyces sp. enrichment culture]
MSVYHHQQMQQQTMPRADAQHILRQGFHDQILGLLMFIAATALWVVPMATQSGPKDAQVNEAVVGILLTFVVGRRLYLGGGVRSDVVVGLCGLWMIVSPFVLGLQKTAVDRASLILDVAVGSVLVLLSAISLLVLRADRRATEGAAGRRREPVGGS